MDDESMDVFEVLDDKLSDAFREKCAESGVSPRSALKVAIVAWVGGDHLRSAKATLLAESDCDYILDTLRDRTGGGVPISTTDLTLLSRSLDSDRRKAAIRTLVERGKITATTTLPNGPGRPVTKYQIA